MSRQLAPVQRLKERLTTNETWKKFRSQMKTLWQSEFITQIDEIKTAHLSRTVRSLNTGMPTARRVAEAAAQDQAVRSRCVEIVINAVVVRNQMQMGISTIQKYLETHYFDTLKAFGVSGVNDRKAIISSLLSPYQQRFDRVCTLIEVADIVINDLEAAGWAVKHMVEALTVATKREGL